MANYDATDWDQTLDGALESVISGDWGDPPVAPPTPPPPAPVGSFLRLNGIQVPVALKSSPAANQETIGKMRRTVGATAVVPRRARKGIWRFGTTPRTAAESLAFRELIAGAGQVLSFEGQDFYTSKGMAPVSLGAGWAIGTSPKFGTYCANSTTNNAVWQFFSAGLPFTLAYYLNAGGAGWHQYIYRTNGVSLGNAWIDGVAGYGFADCLGLVSVTGGAITFGRGSGTSKWDDIVALPYYVPDDWPPQMFDWGDTDGQPFSSLPQLTADGLYIEQNTKKTVLGGDTPAGKLLIANIGSGVVKNFHEFTFELNEL